MVLSKEDIKRYTARLLRSRSRILNEHAFYGLLLMHMRFGLDEGCATAYTDGERIAFSPAFLDELSEKELDFVMMHEVLHVALEHCERTGELDPTLFNIATDIVVNSNLLLAAGMYLPAITLAAYGEAMHTVPDGREGHLFTAEEVYRMLLSSGTDGKGSKGSKKSKGAGGGASAKSSSGKNSPHTDGDADQKTPQGGAKGQGGRDGKAADGHGHFDDHSHWGEEATDDSRRADTWRARVAAAAAVVSVNDPDNAAGSLPLGLARLLKERRRSQVDWRTLLCEFVQEEIADWSFSPPDRRFPDSPFFLPDFNGTVDRVRNILFMIDTSASMSDDMIAAAYSEVLGAIEQFDGVLEGYLGFFDASVVPPVPFSTVPDVLAIRPRGGGGTSFIALFKYIAEHMSEEPPASVIILTDGYAFFPEEKVRGDIPVLWLINNEEVTPPFGKVARIKI